jgi:hypothetical protein
VEKYQKSQQKMFFNIFLTILLAILALYLYVYHRYQYFKRQRIPGPKPKFPFGNFEGSIRGRQNVVYDIDDMYK